MIEKIQWLVVFLAFCVGLLFVVMTDPHVEYVSMIPTPNEDKEFESNDGKCFHFEPQEVSCPADKGQIHSFQELNRK